MRLPSPRSRHKIRQAGPHAGAVVVTAPPGRWSARAGLAQRIRAALVRRQVIKAVAQIPAGAALIAGLAIGLVIGAALMLSVLLEASKGQQ